MSTGDSIHDAVQAFLPIKAANPEVVVIADADNGRDFLGLFLMFISKARINQLDAQPKAVIPLFVTTNPGARLSGGLRIPSEFVLDGLNLHRLAERIRQLRAVHPGGVGVDFLRAMGTGAFRKRLFLDDDNHSKGEMEPLALNPLKTDQFERGWTDKDQKFWAERLSEELKKPNISNKGDDQGENREHSTAESNNANHQVYC